MNTDLQSWEKAAADWDERIAQQDTYRTHLITDALEKILPSVNGLKVLDAGCGNGYYSQWLAERGAQVFGIDGSTEMIKIAQAKYSKIYFKVQDLTGTISEPNESYNLIVANMLLMHMDSVKVFFSESKRLLKPGGELVFSVLHPCFNVPTAKLYKTWWQKLTQAMPSALVYDYYSHQTGRYESHFKTELTHYHRTLEEYSEKLRATGFNITQIVEPHSLPPEFLKSNPKLEYAQRLPRFIFLKCKPQ